MAHFTTAKRLFDELVEDDLTVNITPSPRSTRGDVQTVAQLEELENAESERFDTTQYTIRIENDAGEYYGEVLIHVLDDAPAALIDWVNIVDEEHRGHDIGRTLHEEAVNFIDSETTAERIYTKIQNTRMQSVNIETGFQPVNGVSGQWYRRE